MTFKQWEYSVPEVIRADRIWTIEAYRLALFLADLAFKDGSNLAKRAATKEHADQLIRATARIAPNISEGYSRNTGRERARYYEFAIGSTRESRDWYYQARSILGETVAGHRMELCTQILRLSLTMVAGERKVNRRLG